MAHILFNYREAGKVYLQHMHTSNYTLFQIYTHINEPIYIKHIFRRTHISIHNDKWAHAGITMPQNCMSE